MPMRRRGRLRTWLVLLLILAVAVTALSECWLVPMLSSIGIHRSQAFYQQTIYGIVADVMEETGITGADLVVIQTDQTGRLTAMTSDTATLNRLQAELNCRLTKEINSLDSMAFSVPIGSVFGGVFAAHRGPSLTFRLTANGIIAVRLEDSITPAGINQTCYTLSVTVDQDMLLIYAGRCQTLTLSSTVMVAQTVLFGDVPDTFATWEN